MDYKVTKVGKIPAHWNVEKIDSLKSKEKHAIAMGPFGSRIKKENFIEFGVPIIRGNNLKRFNFDESEFVYVSEEKAEELKSSIVKKGDLVITHRGTLGQVGIIPENSKFEKYIVSQSGMKLTCDSSKVNNDFLYYYLNSRMGQYHLLMNKSQVGVPAIAQASTSLKKIPVPLPPLNEQLAIVKVLNMINEKINVVIKEIQILEEMSQALFKHWFIDFEFPNEAGQPYKSSGGDMVESELGRIPKGWSIKKLGELTSKFCTGLNPRKNFVLGEGNNYYVTIKNMGENNVYLNDKCDKVTDEAIKIINKRSDLKKGDLLFSGIGTIGRTYLIPEDPINWNISESIFTIRPVESISSEYLYQLMLSEKIQNYCKQLASGSVQKGIRKSDLVKYSLALSHNELEKEYTKIIKPMIRQIQSLNEENIKLQDLRNTLLPQLLSGRIDISDELVVD
ncbi:restriction endonuclease subunit S (plasmid) [Priestia megaterium]|uniref:restriction endonuclease subunit S n=1 Tax=Priestia megaterium TaxID=1404 RepID=UPI00196B1B2E|nr:restriction endonuclease subunit S [Priestia megaterium]QSF36393.1 restriction endonuclease subunit S [Priestia megaterium]